MIGWSWDVLNDVVAPRISEFDEANIPEVASSHPESAHWLSNYFLNSVFRATYSSPNRELAFLLLRRVTVALHEYELARRHTTEWVERRAAGEQPIRTYLLALQHWEQCVAAAWQAVAALSRITGARFFETGDGSETEKLNHIYNRSKHADSAIEAGRLPDNGRLSVWLANDGLQSSEMLLTWSELREILDELCTCADDLQDPMSATNDAG